jgi:hypothetical protein
MNSPFFSLNTKDFVKGLFVAVFTAVITLLYNSVQAGDFVFNWKAIGMAALTSGLAYIMKNLLTNYNDEILKKEPKVDY